MYFNEFKPSFYNSLGRVEKYCIVFLLDDSYLLLLLHIPLLVIVETLFTTFYYVRCHTMHFDNQIFIVGNLITI
jgi:hypothetical protein